MRFVWGESGTQDQDQITRVTLGGVTYHKAPASFWTAEAGAGRAQLAGGRWAKVPSGKVLRKRDFSGRTGVLRAME